MRLSNNGVFAPASNLVVVDFELCFFFFSSIFKLHEESKQKILRRKCSLDYYVILLGPVKHRHASDPN